VLGYRKGVVVGATLMALGHFCMAFQELNIFFLALALLIVGNGFFKPNMSTVVGCLYAPEDPRRDSGYTIFYMSVNIGAALAPIVLAFAVDHWGIHIGFTLAGFGMLFGLLVFLKTQKLLHGIADPPPEAVEAKLFGGLTKEMGVYIGGALAIGVMWKLVQMHSLVGWALSLTGAGLLIYLLGFSFMSEVVTRHRLWVVIVLTTFGVVFWSFFEQAGSSLQLFADRNVNMSVMGYEVHPVITQSINPIWIILLGMPFAWMWLALDRRKLNPSTPLKFGLGIAQLGLGFAALYYGASVSAETGVVAFGWLVLGYLLHTTGELCLSPIGLSMISRLAPKKMGAMMMGTWYLSIAFASYAAGLIAKLMSIDTEGGAEVDLLPTDTVMVYGTVFGQIAMVAIGVGLLLAIVSPLIRRGMHDVR
jgi:POT family proton-dependent oligopeptide transporter